MVCPDIGSGLVFQSQDRPVPFHRRLHFGDLSAAVGRRLNVFSTALNPFHGTVELHCDITDQGLFRIDVEFTSEPSAYLRCNDPYPVLRQTQHQGQLGLEEMGNLCGRPNREFVFALLILGQHASRFQCDGCKALVDDSLVNDSIGILEGLVDISLFLPPPKSNVVWPL